MNAIHFGFIGMWESVAILGVAILFFGAKKLPELARGLGQGIREFKKSSQETAAELSVPARGGDHGADSGKPTSPRP